MDGSRGAKAQTRLVCHARCGVEAHLESAAVAAHLDAVVAVRAPVEEPALRLQQNLRGTLPVSPMHGRRTRNAIVNLGSIVNKAFAACGRITIGQKAGPRGRRFRCARPQ